MAEFYESSLPLETKKKSDLEVVLIGDEDCAPGHAYGPVLRPFHLLHFVTAGRGVLHIRNEVYQVGPGGCFLIPAEQVAYYRASEEDPWRYAWVGFVGLRAEDLVRRFQEIAPERYVLRNVDAESYAGCIRRASGLTGAGDAEYFYANSVLLDVVSRLVADLAGRSRNRYAPSLPERVRFVLDVKYAERIRIGDLAASFGVHPNYLTRVFRERFGVSPKQYLTDIKLNKAAYLLSSTPMPVSLVAATLGFDDPLAFSKVFKRAFGDSPAMYRKRQEVKARA